MKTEEIKAALRYSIASADIDTGHINRTLTVDEKEELLKYLIGFYRDAPELLNKFFQSKSDACIFEATEQEQLEKDFRGYVLSC